jgi:phage-related holin
LKDIFNLLMQQLTKMQDDKSWLFGVAGGFTIGLPGWVSSKSIGLEHGILMLILLAVFVMEWLIGGRLAKQSNVKQKSSTVMIDSAIRDVIIIICCVAAYGVDYLIGTGSIIYTVLTCAFIYHNLYSLFANIVVLGWGKHFPMWLIKWLEDEVEAKKEKYFPQKD